MTDMNLTLRLRADNKGMVSVVESSVKKIGELGDSSEKAGTQAERGMRTARSGVESLGNSLSTITRIATGAFVALGGYRVLNQTIRAITQNSIQQEQVLAQLEARIRSTGGAAGRSIEELTEFSRELQDTTTFANEDIERMMATLMTFTSVAGDQFDGATRAILNMSTALGTDLQSSALQVGKALNDPIQGVTALQRAGIQLNDAQREQIRLMVEAGDVAGAQTIILRELETQFGGAAEAARGTFGGALAGLRNAFDDLLKFRGDMGGLAVAIESITLRLQDPELAAAIESGLSAVLELIPPLIDRAVDALTFLIRNLDLIIETMKLGAGIGLTWLGVFRGIPMVLAVAQGAYTTLAGAISLKNAGMVQSIALTRTSIMQVGLLASAMGLLFAAVAGWQVGKYLSEQFLEVRLAGYALVRGLLMGWEEVIGAMRLLGDIGTEIFERIGRVWNRVWAEMQETAAERLRVIAEGMERIPWLRDRVEGLYEFSAGLEESALKSREAAEGGRTFGEIWNANREEIAAAKQLVDEIIDDLVDYEIQTSLAANATKAQSDGLAELRNQLDAASRALAGLTSGQGQGMETAFARQLAALNREAEALAGGAAAWREYQRELFITQELTKLGTAATEEQISIITEAAQRVFDLREAAAGDHPSAKTFFGLDLDWVMGRLQEVKKELEEIAQIEWGFENLIDSFNPLAAQMRRLGEEIDLIDEALSRGLISNFQAGMAKTAVAADAAFAAMMAGVDRTSKEYRQLEVAQQAVNVALGIAAILQQGMGDPYTAIPRMIAMAAMVAQLVDGISGLSGGGGGGAAQRQEQQGTGSVLGDAEAKSESILRATEITADATRELVGINRGMLRALLALQRGIGGAVVRLARGAGRADFDSMGLDASGSFASALGILGGSSKITDQGIVIVGGILSDLIERVVAGAYQEVQSRSWRFGRRRTRVGIETLDQGLLDQFSLIFQSLADTVLEGAVALGLSRDEVAAAIARFNVAEVRISLLDMTAEEQQAEIEAVFGEIFDGMAGSIVPYIRQFQQVGEGLGETLVRVATGVQITQEAIRRFGWGIDELDPERMAQISEDLIGLSGGLEDFIGGIVGFFDRFATDAHRLAVAQDDLERAFGQAGITLPATRDEMWGLMRSLDATTESGREQIAMLLELAGAAHTYYSLLERVSNERESLERRILQLQGDTAALRELELQRLDESNRHLQERIWAIEEELQIASEKESLERRILQLQGDTAALRELELAGLDESNRHLQERIWALEDEISATEQVNRNAEALADILRDAGEEMARLTMSPLRFEFRQLTIAQRELTARVRELTDSEDDLAHVRRMQDLQNLALAERARERLRSIQEQLWGVVQSADIEPDYRPIDQAAGRIRDALVRALESVAEWVRRSAFEDPSLTPVQQMDAMQREFDRLMTIALTGSGQEQADAIAALPQLASQMEQLGVQLWGTATQEFHEFRTGLVDAMQRVLDSVVAPPVPDPVTGAQVAGIAGSLQQVALTLAEQKVLAAEALEVLGVIRALTGDSPLEIAREFGVPLRDAIELLIGELSEGTAETIERLAHIANTLGITLGDLSDEIGLNIGELIDHESLLSQALRDVIGALPAGIQDELLEPLMRIWAATSDADANEALAQLLAVTDELPAWIRNLLAPYFEEIDPVDYLIEQVGLLEQIRELDRRQAEAAEATVALLDRVVGNLRAANEAADIPAYARGGWASGVIRTGEIGPELVLPHDVSQFFQRVGVPINAGGMADGRIVERLDRLVEIEADSGRKLEGIAEAQQRAGIEIATGLQDIRSAVRERDLAWAAR